MGADGESTESSMAATGGEEVTHNVRCSNSSKFSLPMSLGSTVATFKAVVAPLLGIGTYRQLYFGVPKGEATSSFGGKICLWPGIYSAVHSIPQVKRSDALKANLTSPLGRPISPENTLASDSESRSSQVGTSTLSSQVGASTPQASTPFPHRDAFGDIKDEAEDKFNEETWFTSDDKRNKMSKHSIVELLEEFSLPLTFTAQVPALQEPANYGTDLETSVNEGQIRSGYRLPMHPYDVAFFNYYNMAPAQLVPNGWRKLLGLIYLVRTLGHPMTVHDFIRLYLEVCFIENMAKSVGWYYIHNRVRIIKGGPKSNEGWHS
ncbi:hypothetical protein RJ639_019800 [Escallonia herrerae]|uniref:Transposase (putative) gypsy type domain-containing protein n=1 Tax=Escallonia herrerae TaxID=1293975 RepID=A0AA89AI32_9ASTE|nr:hypothetical protein RJ639_019800 [Escallonia herrerae]